MCITFPPPVVVQLLGARKLGIVVESPVAAALMLFGYLIRLNPDIGVVIAPLTISNFAAKDGRLGSLHMDYGTFAFTT